MYNHPVWNSAFIRWVYGKTLDLNTWLWFKQYGKQRAVSPPFTHWFWNSKLVGFVAELAMKISNFLWMKQYGQR